MSLIIKVEQKLSLFGMEGIAKKCKFCLDTVRQTFDCEELGQGGSNKNGKTGGLISENANKLALNRFGIKDDIKQQLVLVWKKGLLLQTVNHQHTL